MVLVYLADVPFVPARFQYSLCRVVLMVNRRKGGYSVTDWSFSTRSVESF